MATCKIRSCSPTRLSVRRIEPGLSLSGTSIATLISATETPGPSVLWSMLPTMVLLGVLLAALPMLDRTSAARAKNPAKKNRPPNDGPVLTSTPDGRAYIGEKGE